MSTCTIEYARRLPRRVAAATKPQSIAGLISFSIFMLAIGCAISGVTILALHSLFWKGDSWGPALFALFLILAPVVLACPVGCLAGLIGVVNCCTRRRLAAIGLIGNAALLSLLVLWRLLIQ